MTSRIAVIDFETTGSSPGQGARATEVAIVIVERGAVVDSYQSLMNGGVWVPDSWAGAFSGRAFGAHRGRWLAHTHAGQRLGEGGWKGCIRCSRWRALR
jgi:H+/Cl- antiporter ClcA